MDGCGTLYLPICQGRNAYSPEFGVLRSACKLASQQASKKADFYADQEQMHAKHADRQEPITATTLWHRSYTIIKQGLGRFSHPDCICVFRVHLLLIRVKTLP